MAFMKLRCYVENFLYLKTTGSQENLQYICVLSCVHNGHQNLQEKHGMDLECMQSQCSTLQNLTHTIHYRTGHQTSNCLNQVLESTLIMWSCITTMVWSWKLLADYKKPEDNTRFLPDTIHTAWRWLRNQCSYCSYRWLWRLIPTMERCTSTMETCFLMKESMRLQLQGTNYPCV